MACSETAAKSLQSCPTLRDSIDDSPPGTPIPGILQARTLEWVAISFSNAWKWKVKVKSLSRVWLLATPWTAAYQAPPSMGFSRPEYWSGVPLPYLCSQTTYHTMVCCGPAPQWECTDQSDSLQSTRRHTLVVDCAMLQLRLLIVTNTCSSPKMWKMFLINRQLNFEFLVCLFTCATMFISFQYPNQLTVNSIIHANRREERGSWFNAKCISVPKAWAWYRHNLSSLHIVKWNWISWYACR